MTMQKIHISHWHRPDWHSFKEHFGHLMHDGRFWAIVALAALVVLMIAAGLFAEQGTPMTTFPPYGFPMYPHWP